MSLLEQLHTRHKDFRRQIAEKAAEHEARKVVPIVQAEPVYDYTKPAWPEKPAEPVYDYTKPAWPEKSDDVFGPIIPVTPGTRPPIAEIQKLVARLFHITMTDLLSKRRTKHVVQPRQIAMYLAKTLTLRSLPEIGRRFGGKDHTTVLHAVRKIGSKMHEPAIAGAVSIVRKSIIERGYYVD